MMMMMDVFLYKLETEVKKVKLKWLQPANKSSMLCAKDYI